MTSTVPHLGAAAVTVRSLALFSLSILATSFAAAQDFPNPKPTEEHAVLKKDAGVWDCAVKMYLGGPTAEPTEFKGVERTRMVSGGLHVVTAFECPMGERTFEGHGVYGYDSSSKKYVGTWVDNFTANPIRSEGVYDAEADTMTVTATVTDEGGNEMTQRQVTTYNADGTKTFTIHLVTEAAGQEIALKLMEMTCTRRKKSTNPAPLNGR